MHNIRIMSGPGNNTMDMLAIPLRLENGQLARIPQADAYKQYIDFFFSARKYETPAFGVETDEYHWLPPSEYLRVLIKEFLRSM